MSVTFMQTWMLFVAPIVGLIALGAVLLGHARRRTRLARFGSPEALERLAPVDAAHPPRWRAWRLGIAALALAVAFAGPRWGESADVMQTDGIDIAIAMDVSLSMLAEDEKPNRLERMKQEVRRLRAIAPGDRVALIAFAGRSYVLTPLTSDDGALELFLQNLDPTLVGVAGSSITPPLRQGVDLLQGIAGGADRALVLMSDGEAFDDAGEAHAVANEARELGIHLVTVGFGTQGGGTIPLPETGGAEVKKDHTGEIVVTAYDDELLRGLAETAEGTFIPAEVTDKGTRIRRALADLEASRREEELRLARPPQHIWFALVAVILLLIDAFLADGGQWPRRLRAASERRAPRSSRASREVAAIGGAVALALTLGAAPLGAQQPSHARAVEAHRAGRLTQAIREYRAVIGAGDRSAEVVYNLGTALLAADSTDAAIEALERAVQVGNAEVRRRARYNLGLAYLKRGLRLEGQARTAALGQSRQHLRTVLLESPGDRDAQWNFEMALRASNQPQNQQNQQQQRQQPQQPPPRDQMTQQQAEALLDAAAREEREVQARRQRGERQQRTAGSRDW